MRVLSLFDGIACGRLALERAGIKVDSYDAYEIESNAIKAAVTNFPDIIEHGDVTKEDFVKFKGKIDLLIGGSPCQGFSSSGKQLNFNDPRSKLFFEYVRAIKECQPKYFLLEVEMNNPAAIRGRRINKATIVGRRLDKNGHRQDYNKDIPITQCLEVRATNVDKSNCLTTVDKDNVLTSLPVGRYPDVFNKKLPFRYYTTKEMCRLQTLPDNYLDMIPNTAARKALGNGWTVDVIAHILRNIPEKDR